MVIVSGGQSGADRAGLDAAIACGLPYRGWVPLGGWAEDKPEPPGLLGLYPGLQESDSANPGRRTWLNARDADATLILWPRPGRALSRGTALTRQACRAMGKPCALFDPFGGPAGVADWLSGVAGLQALNIAGPRESQAPGVYAAGRVFLEQVFAQAPFV